MAVEIKDVEQVAQDLQQKFDDFKAKNDKRIDAIEAEKGKLAGEVETLNGKLTELDQLKSKRAARTVLTGMCYSVGSATRQGSSSLTRFIGQSAMTSRT